MEMVAEELAVALHRAAAAAQAQWVVDRMVALVLIQISLAQCLCMAVVAQVRIHQQEQHLQAVEVMAARQLPIEAVEVHSPPQVAD
jgi:hypothetical protein